MSKILIAFLAIFVFFFLLVPFSSFAQTEGILSNDQFLKIIQQLQEQIKSLQNQITKLQSELGVTIPETQTPSIPTVESETEEPKTDIIEEEIKIPEFTKTLFLGSWGEEVRNLQAYLAKDKEIYPEGLITGYFGPLTQVALKKWQEKNGISAVGIVGSKTRKKFLEIKSETEKKGKETIKRLIEEDAGASGIIPPGHLKAPEIQKKIEAVATATPSIPSIIATTTTTSIATTTTIMATTTLFTTKTPFKNFIDFMPGELLLKFKDNVSLTEHDTLLKGWGLVVKEEIKQIKVKVVNVPEETKDKLIQALSQNPKIDFVEKNFLASVEIIPNDSNYNSQWHLPKISAPAAWDISTGDSQTILAVIDSGVDPAHPDLSSKLLSGYSYYKKNTDTSDVHGHGTAVAGTAAAVSNNLTGVTGVLWQNFILPLAVTSRGGFASYSDIASAVIYAADHNAKVINISIGGSFYSSTLQNAVNYAWNKRIVIVAAAGNKGTSTLMYPAALKNVVASSATDSSDNLASFSNYGDWIDLSAPGVNILTTNNGGGYGYWSGTSFSSPIVAALAALIFSVNPSLTNAEVVNLMKQNADDLGTPGFDNYYGYGRVNAYKTIFAVSGTKIIPTTPIAPTVPAQPPATSTTTISDTIIPTMPTNLTTTAVSSTQINLSWTASTDNVGVAGYRIYRGGAQIVTVTASTSYSDIGLSPVATYSYTIAAYDAAGNISNQTAPVSVTTLSPQDTTPPVISNVQVTGIVTNGATFTWTTNEPAYGQVEFGFDTNYGYTSTAITGLVTSARVVLTALDVNKTYHYRIKSTDAAGNVAVSEDYTFTTQAISCVGPYHGLAPDGRCVWSCGTGTQPDDPNNPNGQCVCKSGYTESGTDQFGRRVCTQTTAALPTIDLKAGTSSSGPWYDGTLAVTMGSDGTSSFSLYWTSSNATSCIAGDRWAVSGSKPLNGTHVFVGGRVTGLLTYSLSCSNASGTSTDTVYVNVGASTVTDPLVCKDTDGGKDYSVKGSVYSSDISHPYYTDYCDGNILHEFSCNPLITSITGITQSFYTCPNGCLDGVCIQNATTTSAVSTDGNLASIFEALSSVLQKLQKTLKK